MAAAAIDAAKERLRERMSKISSVVLILSGKGGVGKSTVTTQMALALKDSGKKVGVLDVDICGPSIPHMLGVGDLSVHQTEQGWVPVFSDEAGPFVMSIAFLLGSKDTPVVWRGPKKTAIIRQFLADVLWGELDYLLVDTPPGTSDEHMAIVEFLQSVGVAPKVVLVTTPQAVAVDDVRREVDFVRKTNLDPIGIVENMSGFACPCCGLVTPLFDEGGGKLLASKTGLPFLGSVPIDPAVVTSGESGKAIEDVVVNRGEKEDGKDGASSSSSSSSSPSQDTKPKQSATKAAFASIAATVIGRTTPA